MSNQGNIGNEKQIASYQSEFKEKSLAKPQEVSLVITAAHLHGRAYIWERDGTKEGDAEYQRFVCPLEEISKVYINDSVKASPLYIQCDSSNKGVFHRKTIVIPCLENVSAIVDQINDVRAKFMEKYEAQQQREAEKKRAALKAEREKEMAGSDVKNEGGDILPALPESVPETIPAPESKSAPKPASALEESIKALEKLESIKAAKPITIEKLPRVSPVTAEPVTPVPAASSIDSELPPVHILPEIPEFPELPSGGGVQEAYGEVPETAVPMAAEPVYDTFAPANGQAEEVYAPEVSAGDGFSLEQFESAVLALKSRLDSGEITADIFSMERKKLIAALY